MIARSVGRRIGWVVGWVCGKGLSGFVFVKCVYLGCCDGILLGQEMGVSSGNLEWTLAG